MKHLLLSTWACIAVFAGTATGAAAGAVQAQPQQFAGTWQGTLQAGRPLRTVIKLSPADGGGLRAVFYSIDQGGQGIPATVTVQGTTLRLSLSAINGTYEGRISADGNAIEGKWAQGGNAIALNLSRATSDTAWAIPEPPAPPKPMAATANPSFEVATIKPGKVDTPGKAFLVRGRLFSTVNTTLSDLIAFAYGVHAKQITNAPAWVETEKYDLSAQPDGEGQPNEKQWKAMVQKLLADRFKLSFHRDRKELPAYVIVTAKGGPKLTRSEGDPNGLPSLFFRGLGVMPAANATMGDLAGVLQGTVLDRPVVDQTGLSGRFDFTLTWTPDESQFGGLGARVPAPAANDPAAAPGLFTAIQEQLGLKLDSTRAAVEVLVVDRVERPSEN